MGAADGPQPLDGIGAGGGADHVVGSVEGQLQSRGQHVAAAREVHIEGALGHAGLSGDPRGGGAADTVSGHQVQGHPDDLPLALLAGGASAGRRRGGRGFGFSGGHVGYRGPSTSGVVRRGVG